MMEDIMTFQWHDTKLLVVEKVDMWKAPPPTALQHIHILHQFTNTQYSVRPMPVMK